MADYSLQRVREVIQNIKLLDSGYIIMINQYGKIISHPVREYLSMHIEEIDSLKLDFSKVSKMQNNRFYEAKELSCGGSIHRDRLIYKRGMHSGGWSVLVVLNTNETLVNDPESTELGQHYRFDDFMNVLKVKFILLLAFTAFILFLLVSWRMENKMWLASIAFSLLCLFSTIAIWYNNQVGVVTHVDEKVQIYNKTDLEAALNTFERLDKEQKVSEDTLVESVKIRTGFFIQSVKFSSSNDVFVTGYAWQKLPKEWRGRKECVTDSSQCLGFILPEAESTNMQVVHSDGLITRWYFEASLRQEFDYLKYPFDEESVWIRARPKDFFLQGTTLVPDFDAYPDFEMEKDVGLEKDIFVEGWDIRSTFYSFKMNEYSSNFGGVGESKIVRNRPDLYFNVSIRREFLGVFVAYMIPIIVIAFLLFAVIMIRTAHSELSDKLGYSASTVLGYAASLFFVLVISHMSMRETLNAKGIIYLEYFFFSLYVAIGVVSVNAIMFSYRSYSGKVQSLVLQYLYWPALLLSILVATVMRFS